MQKAALRRLLTIVDIAGSAALIAVPFAGHIGPYTALPGAIGLAFALASLYWTRGDLYQLCVGVGAFMLFAAFLGWATAFWGTYASVGGTLDLALTVACALISIAFLLVMAVAGGVSKEQK